MNTRCHSPSHEAYARYGGAGIFVCDEWRHDYPAFVRWALASAYRDPLTIDRIENGDGYHPGNCRWATRLQQARNRADNVYIAAFGERKMPADWLLDPRCVVSFSCLKKRINAGEDVESAMQRPAQKQNQPDRQAPRYITAFGETRLLMDWVKDPRCVVKYSTLNNRYHEGWSGEISLTVPSRPRTDRSAAHCSRGHEFTPDNTKLEKNDIRRCRECLRARQTPGKPRVRTTKAKKAACAH